MIHQAWVILIVCSATFLVNYSIRIGAYSILLPGMIKDLEINMTQAGMIRASYFFTYILLSPLIGWLTDRIGGRFVISFFCLFLGTGTFLMGQASSLLTAVLFHGIMGIGAAAIWTPIVTLIQKWFGTAKRGFALGVLSASPALGSGLMGVVLPSIVRNQGWRTGWYLLGISGLILIVINSVFLRNDPNEMNLLPWGEGTKLAQSYPKSPPSFNYWDIFKGGHFWLIGVSYSLISMGSYIITDFIVTYGVRELKIHHSVASAFISIMALASIPGGILLMSLSDYIGRKKSLLAIHCLVTLSIFFIIFAGNASLLRGGIAFFGFLHGAIWPMYAACARDFFPKEVLGRAIGLFTLFYGIGAMVGPVIAGHLTDVTGTFRWSFGLGALVSLLGGFLIAFLGKPKELVKKGD